MPERFTGDAEEAPLRGPAEYDPGTRAPATLHPARVTGVAQPLLPAVGRPIRLRPDRADGHPGRRRCTARAARRPLNATAEASTAIASPSAAADGAAARARRRPEPVRPACATSRFAPPEVLFRLGLGRRLNGKAPRHQREAGRADPLRQSPLPAFGGPVPDPGDRLGNDRGDREAHRTPGGGLTPSSSGVAATTDSCRHHEPSRHCPPGVASGTSSVSLRSPSPAASSTSLPLDLGIAGHARQQDDVGQSRRDDPTAPQTGVLR